MRFKYFTKKIILSILAIFLSGFFLFFFISKANVTNYFKKSEKNTRQEESRYDNIHVNTTEEQDNEGRSLLYLSKPVTENTAINKIIDSISDDFISKYHEESKRQERAYLDYFHKTGLEAHSSVAHYTQHFDIPFANEDYLIVVFDQSRHTGGTGDNSVFSHIFSRQSGEEIPLSNIFLLDNYLEYLSDLSREKLYLMIDERVSQEQFEREADRLEWASEIYKQANEGTEPILKNFDGIVINEDGSLTVYFDKYQVASGSEGIIEIVIPFSEIADILSPDIINLFNLKEEEAVTKPKKPTIKQKTKSNINCELEKCVALTFDDGPSIFTNELLDILKEKNISVTFFVLGKSAKVQPETIRRIVEEGHVIGNHGWDHKNFKNISLEQLRKQIDDTNNLIKDISDYSPNLLRPPYGAYDKQILKNTGMPFVLWNVDPQDWKDRDSRLIKDRVSKAKRGSIILAHDIYKTTIEAIPEIIDNLLNENIKFVTVPELFAPQEMIAGKVYSQR